MKIVYRGSFAAAHDPLGSEDHIANALASLGHEVVRIQECDLGWGKTLEVVAGTTSSQFADLFLWTCTQAFAERWPVANHAVETLKGALPTAAVHLDRFWDLEREPLIHTEPWFRLQHVFTADGDNDDRWRAAGVNHHLMMACAHRDTCVVGAAQDKYRAEIAFVGSYMGYHKEYPARLELIEWLMRIYGSRFRLFPDPGKPNIYGSELSDLFASVDVVVGDTIFAERSARCTSNRPFETWGRGGFLLQPRVACVTEALCPPLPHDCFYTAGDFDELEARISFWLDRPDERRALKKPAMAHIREHHTYQNRVRQMLDVLGLSS